MPGLRSQISGMIKTCETALASKKDDLYVDENTISVSTAILKKAQTEHPNDTVLAAAVLKPPFSWQQILSAMQTVLASLPLTEQTASTLPPVGKSGTWS